MPLTHAQLRQTTVYTAVLICRIFFSPTSAVVYGAILIAFILFEKISLRGNSPALIGIGLLLGVLWILHRFVREELEAGGSISHPDDVAEALSYHMVQHLSTKPEITPTTLLEAATESVRGKFVLQLIGIEPQQILSTVRSTPITDTLETCLQWVQDARLKLKTGRLDSTATIFAFLIHVPTLKELLNKADLSEEDLQHVLEAEAFHWSFRQQEQHWFSPRSLVRSAGSIGRTWIIGYNTILEHLTTNVSEHILSHGHHTILHQSTLESMEKMLAGGKGTNILLLGPSGIGKRTLVRNLAYRIREREIASSRAFTDVLVLSTPLLLSGSGRSDETFLKALQEIKDGGKFILVIEDVAPFLKAADTRLKAILVSVLQARNVRTICLADTADYHMLIKNDSILDSLFEKTYLNEPSDREVMGVLLGLYFHRERSMRLQVTYKALASLLDLTKRCMGHGALPGKAVTVLEETMGAIRRSGNNTVTDQHIRDVISRITRIDVRMLTEHDKIVLLTLQDRLKQHVIGQDHAMESIVNALKRSRMDVSTRKRPIGTFLFLGTTGVGKTETAKALAEEYFGTSEHFIRVDLNEYGEETSIPSLIGGQTSGGFVEGFLTRKVQDMPFSLILLDEIEKAHPKVLHLFLQILDEGRLIDGQGVTNDFRNTIIIATSNAGSRWILGQPTPTDATAKESFRKALMDEVMTSRSFSPEFINRFDEVIVFYPPTPSEIQQITILMLDQIVKDVLARRGIQITVEQGVVELLAKRGYNPQFGAREMRRTVTQTVENYLADYLLQHEVKRGETIGIGVKDIE
ncbi:MAG: AAA family ATPase [Candidatus Peribacteraceae bacterium]|nr:AAA family ATPase [Candidatus Peribacteraceae bacterium]